MEIKNIALSAIGVAIAALIVVSLLVPIVNDATSTTTTFENKGYFYVDTFDTTEDLTVSWDHENPGVITVNDDEVPVNLLGHSDSELLTLVSGSTSSGGTFALVVLSTSSDGTIKSVRYSGATGGSVNASISAGTDLTLTCTGGTATVSDGTNTATASYTSISSICADKTNLVMKDSTVSARLLTTSNLSVQTIANMALVTGGSVSGTMGEILSGTVASPSITVWRASSSVALKAGTLTVNKTAISEYTNLYSVDTVSFTTTLTDTVGEETKTADTDITLTSFVVPAEVTASKVSPMDATQATMLNIVPILVIIGLLCATVALIIARK